MGLFSQRLWLWRKTKNYRHNYPHHHHRRTLPSHRRAHNYTPPPCRCPLYRCVPAVVASSVYLLAGVACSSPGYRWATVASLPFCSTPTSTPSSAMLYSACVCTVGYCTMGVRYMYVSVHSKLVCYVGVYNIPSEKNVVYMKTVYIYIVLYSRVFCDVLCCTCNINTCIYISMTVWIEYGVYGSNFKHIGRGKWIGWILMGLIL